MRLLLFAGSFIFTAGIFSQQVTFEENFSGGLPATWTIVNSDGLIPAEAVDTFDNAWISFADEADTCVASTSYYEPAGQSGDYLITPKITLNTFSKLVWSARSYDASYPDDYLVLISTTDSLVGSFTDTLMVVQEELFYWHNRSVQLDLEGYANQDIYIAFKNITTDGFILMIDDVKMLGSDFASASESSLPQISLYPNPATDYIRFAGVPAGAVFTIYSVTGEIVQSGSESQLNIVGLISGAYFVQIRTEDEIVTLPFIKQ